MNPGPQRLPVSSSALEIDVDLMAMVLWLHSHWRRHHLTILPLQGISAKIPQRSGLRSAEQNNEFTVNVHVAERIFMLTSCR